MVWRCQKVRPKSIRISRKNLNRREHKWKHPQINGGVFVVNNSILVVWTGGLSISNFNSHKWTFPISFTHTPADVGSSSGGSVLSVAGRTTTSCTWKLWGSGTAGSNSGSIIGIGY